MKPVAKPVMVDMTNLVTHASASDAAAAKDLHGVVGHLQCDARGLVFKQSDRAGQHLCLLLVAELRHLVGNVLEPVRNRLAIGNHGANLGANDGLLDERLAKDDTLVGPLEALCKYANTT